MTLDTLRHVRRGAILRGVTSTGPGLRERKKQATHDALVGSALRQFAARGYDHVTVEDIVHDCEVSYRTFFRYFATKEDVLFADGDRGRANLLAALAEQPPGVRPLAALRAAVRALAEEYEHDRATILLRSRIITDTPELRTRAVERQHGWESAAVEELRRSGRADGLSELDVRLLVAAATTALRVATELWIADDGHGDLRDLLDAALDRVGAGFGG
jgi:AcrR family transcriptional regulator